MKRNAINQHLIRVSTFPQTTTTTTTIFSTLSLSVCLSTAWAPPVSKSDPSVFACDTTISRVFVYLHIHQSNPSNSKPQTKKLSNKRCPPFRWHTRRPRVTLWNGNPGTRIATTWSIAGQTPRCSRQQHQQHKTFFFKQANNTSTQQYCSRQSTHKQTIPHYQPKKIRVLWRLNLARNIKHTHTNTPKNVSSSILHRCLFCSVRKAY